MVNCNRSSSLIYITPNILLAVNLSNIFVVITSFLLSDLHTTGMHVQFSIYTLLNCFLRNKIVFIPVRFRTCHAINHCAKNIHHCTFIFIHNFHMSYYDR